MKKLTFFISLSVLILKVAIAQNTNPDLFSAKKRKPQTHASVRKASDITIDGRLNRNALPYLLYSAPASPENLAFLISFDQEKKTPYFIKRKSSGAKNTRKLSLIVPELCKKEAANFLNEINPVLKLRNSANEFEIQNTEEGDLRHIRFTQKVGGVPVLGGDGIIHLREDGNHTFHGQIENVDANFNTTPSVSVEQVIKTAVYDLKKTISVRTLTAKEQQILEYEGPEATLVIVPRSEMIKLYELAWEVSIRPNLIDHYHYYVSAVTGKIIFKENHTCTAVHATGSAPDLNGVNQSVISYLDGTTYYLIDTSTPMFNATKSDLPEQPVGAIWTMSAENTDLTSIAQITSTTASSWTPTAVSAHSNAKICYNYYQNTHNRNSLNGQGGNIISVINVTDGGKSMENAYWNGKLMAYGNGGSYFKPLAGALDVAAHEMTHGVIQNSCNLKYSGQTGAINESLADIFGSLVDRDDWQIGEAITKNLTLFPSGALRDLSNPHNGGTTKTDYCWQPQHMDEFVNTTSDNGGVHTNSGIPNKAFYLFATQVTKEKAEKVYYLAMTKYLFASSRFIDLRISVVGAATELYGENSNEVTQAKSAFDQVGIFEGQATKVEESLPENPGDEYLLVTKTLKDNYRLETIETATSTKTLITSTKVGRKPSISDNGSVMYFVTPEGIIKQIYTVGNSEVTFDNSRKWNNVSVSKDGTKIAAVTDDEDSSIYVRKTSAGSPWIRFILYNPTFTPDSVEIKSNGPKYADALEWDHFGERIMYDCYNLIKGNKDSVVFWDVNFIKVWDNAENDFSDGTVTKLYADLPQDISIGNPSFSKNSPNIIVYEIIDESVGYVDMVSTNLETSEGNFILNGNNGMLCFPSFNKSDTKIGFTTMGARIQDTVFAYVNMDVDKITPIDGFYDPTITGKYFNYYANGARVLGNEPQTKSQDFRIYPNPFDNQLTIDFNPIGEAEIILINNLGQNIYQEKLNLNSFIQHKLTLPELKAGTYIIQIVSKDGIFTSKLLKL
ncbi:MAG: M4 family metallopeptidase [Sporocytophaga sp.]|uniref:M4 family metallopeptidase n=1 Tax=Sporocytophaga sp. TaxID=2231183 RepID=UPI001B03DCD0|nr:M4 family metallopeptidase [Sporocytophaga sp.]MBO9700272.1 M4 family metallopeptidase [Sporocytophaga sp.]